MSTASSHITAINDHAAGFLGVSVNAMRPADVAFSAVAGVIVGNERTEPRESSEGGVDYVKIRDVVASVALLPGAIARIDFIWEVDGDRYATEELTKIDGGYCSFRLRRAESHEISRKGYRGGK